MTHGAAVAAVKSIRQEVVALNGVGGLDTSSINELLDDLISGDWDPEEAVKEAIRIRDRIHPISH